MTMLSLVIAAAAGAVSGRFRRPLGARLRPRAVRHPWLVILGVLIQVLLLAFDLPAPGLWLAVSLATLLAAAVSNLALVGMGVVSVGLAMNLAVVLVNGTMPVRPDALVSAGVVERSELDSITLGSGRTIEEPGDPLAFLGDAIPVPLLRRALSIGDLVILAGVTVLASDLSRPRRRIGEAADAVRERQSAESIERRLDPIDQVDAVDEIDAVVPVYAAAPTLPDADQPLASERPEPTPAGSMHTASADHVWGRAPSPEPSSGFQNSAHPEAPATDRVIVLTDEAVEEATSDPDLVAASHHK